MCIVDLMINKKKEEKQEEEKEKHSFYWNDLITLWEINEFFVYHFTLLFDVITKNLFISIPRKLKTMTQKEITDGFEEG